MNTPTKLSQIYNRVADRVTRAIDFLEEKNFEVAINSPKIIATAGLVSASYSAVVGDHFMAAYTAVTFGGVAAILNHGNKKALEGRTVEEARAKYIEHITNAREQRNRPIPPSA